uniref:Uncharacterized protein n=1 Tax=Mycena chlorophos TaxID=658473 RepID=A0ABQ0L8V8_MYCCL|nr:predicted protein [Mycena chlorophos]
MLSLPLEVELLFVDVLHRKTSKDRFRAIRIPLHATPTPARRFPHHAVRVELRRPKTVPSGIATPSGCRHKRLDTRTAQLTSGPRRLAELLLLEVGSDIAEASHVETIADKPNDNPPARLMVAPRLTQAPPSMAAKSTGKSLSSCFWWHETKVRRGSTSAPKMQSYGTPGTRRASREESRLQACGAGDDDIQIYLLPCVNKWPKGLAGRAAVIFNDILLWLSLTATLHTVSARCTIRAAVGPLLAQGITGLKFNATSMR